MHPFDLNQRDTDRFVVGLPNRDLKGWPMRQIMVATDGSPGADRAVDLAARLAKVFGGELLIVNVGGNLSVDEMRQLERAEGNIGDALDMLARQVLTTAQSRAAALGVDSPKLRALWGDPAESIIAAVEREAVDTVVIGRRGRGRLTGLLLGSVSQKIASLAPCNVVIVP
jgi:nucleotide-binding universal stress UspA family protein